MRAPLATLATLLLAASPAGADPPWAGAGGVPVPVEHDTPVVLDLISVSVTAIPPAVRALDDPRFAEQWEIAARLDLRNPTDSAARLTLAVPEIPLEPGAAGPHVAEMVISQDGLRMPVVPRRFEDLPDIGIPCEAFRSIEVAFAPGQRRRIDVMLRQPAPTGEGGSVIARWLGAGLDRFAGRTVPIQRYSWHFGDRVRLIRGADGASDLEPAGAKTRFFDDGCRSRLEIELRDAPPRTAVHVEAAAAGPGMAPAPVALPGRFRPVAEMNRAELVIARALLRAVSGLSIEDAAAVRLLAELPWGPCNPAFRLARGEPLPDRPVEEMGAAAACPADCRRVRAEPVDPFRDPWGDPLCWYSPERCRAQPPGHDPERRALLAEIEGRLAGIDAETEVARSSGCGCTGAGGSRRGRSLLILAGLVFR